MRKVGSRVASWVVVATVAAMLPPVSMAFAAVANDEVTSVKLKEADGTSGQNTNSGSGVKTGHIQNGAVTNAKIGGNISVDKVETYSGVIIVHSGPADGVHTFNSMNDAINSIITPEQPTYIKVMPGSYDAIDLSKAYLIIEGSGKENTFINGAVSGSTTTPAIIRNLTLGNSWVCADTKSSTTIEDVNCNGALTSRSGAVLKVKDTFVPSGITSEGPAEISNVTIDGPLNLYSPSNIKGSIINGGVYLQSNNGANIVNSQLASIPARARLVNCYDNNFNPIPNQ